MIRLLPLMLLTAASSMAQTEPRVLVVFDTSGSMLWDFDSISDCQGDGSDAHPEWSCEDRGSKLRHAKEALAQVVGGAADVQFGLMRYGQLEPGDPGFGDQIVGAQYLDGPDGDLVQVNYDGGSNGCGPADLLVEPGPASAPQVLSWMDGAEDYPQEKELRANGWTPLTHSMVSAGFELSRMIAADDLASCRPYYVLLLTDGFQQCPDVDADDPVARGFIRAELELHASNLRAFNVLGEVHDVRTFVVGFGRGTRFVDELDAMARAGGTSVNANGDLDPNGNAYQANNPAGLVAALQAAIAEAAPRDLCDGADNDCDNQVDEDYPRLGEACRVGRGACEREGVLECNDAGDGLDCSVEPGDPGVERCDGADNDCDGAVDEGVVNRCGECGDEPAEVCNGVDDDCDGAADEGVVNACGACGELPREVCNRRDDDCDERVDEGALNACGECGDVPSEVCNCEDDDCDNAIDEHSNNCPPCDCTPREEVCNDVDDDCDNRVDEQVLNDCGLCGAVPAELCNGLDDDCDRQIDEAFPESGEACGDDRGVCSGGAWRCEDGRLECEGAVDPRQEVCDGVDNDCDDVTDEGVLNACGFCGPDRMEVCDNVDNDCDGADDNGVLCRDAEACLNGACEEPCEFGECTGDRVCVDGFCLQPCRNTECPDGWVCVEGLCSDPCDDIPCPDGTYCALGACKPDDCFGPVGCVDGQRCVGGVCEDDPCANAACAPGQGCIDGRCFDDCAGVRCPDGELCVNGACGPDDCARVACPYPQVCEGGACVADPCYEVDCGPGHICEGGRCVEDPCNRISCPSGASCHRGLCSHGDGSGVGGSTDAGAGTDGGGGAAGTPGDDGCSCRVPRSGGGGGWYLLLLAIRRRRRG